MNRALLYTAAITVSSLLLFLQALKLLRHSGLMPYVVFVAAPKRERLHSIHRIASDKRKRRLSPPQAGVEESRTYTVRLRRCND